MNTWSVDLVHEYGMGGDEIATSGMYRVVSYSSVSQPVALCPISRHRSRCGVVFVAASTRDGLSVESRLRFRAAEILIDSLIGLSWLVPLREDVLIADLVSGTVA